MSDTQWPRFEVFLQDVNGRLHKNVGTVHAPDAEMALLNARDVFGRRPKCNNLWVVATKHILAITDEELSEHTPLSSTKQTKNNPYAIFQKQSQRRAMTYVVYSGEIMAQSSQEALHKAIKQFDNPNKPTFVWWVCPAEAITKSDTEDVDSLFSPALAKHYKHAYDYKTFTAMRKVKGEAIPQT